MELYFAPLACSMVARIVAEEAEVPLTYREVELYVKRFTASGADYLAEVPRGQVPVLVMDDGERLVEVSAIVQCLAASRPALVGETPRERYRVLEGLSTAATEVHKRILSIVGSRDAPAEAKAHARASAPSVFRDVARAIGSKPFYAGDRFTVADAYLAWATVIARVFGLELGELEPYAARTATVPSVARALAIEMPLGRASWKRQQKEIGDAPWSR